MASYRSGGRTRDSTDPDISRPSDPSGDDNRLGDAAGGAGGARAVGCPAIEVPSWSCLVASEPEVVRLRAAVAEAQDELAMERLTNELLLKQVSVDVVNELWDQFATINCVPNAFA
jgi:hypothetical protein